jgi:gas vesicle protein
LAAAVAKEIVMKSKHMMTLLGGALAGAAVMYLLDPEGGKRRRRYVAKHAGEHLGYAGDAIQSGWHKVSDYAGDVGQTVAERAHDLSGQLSHLAHDYADQAAHRARDGASGWSDQADSARAELSDRAHGWLGRGRDMLRRYGHRAQGYLPAGFQISQSLSDHAKGLWNRARGLGGDARVRARETARGAARQYVGEERSRVIPVALTAVGCCVLGAGLMFIIDPRLGRARRHWLIDKSRSWVKHTGSSFYRTGRHMANRAYGVAAETRGAGEQLVARVQAAVHDVLADPRVVQIMADANGTITLVGRLVADECDRLLKMVESVPGVNLVINHLERKPAENVRESAVNRPEDASRV